MLSFLEALFWEKILEQFLSHCSVLLRFLKILDRIFGGGYLFAVYSAVAFPAESFGERRNKQQVLWRWKAGVLVRFFSSGMHK
jgi:hypothetical protein